LPAFNGSKSIVNVNLFYKCFNDSSWFSLKINSCPASDITKFFINKSLAIGDADQLLGEAVRIIVLSLMICKSFDWEAISRITLMASAILEDVISTSSSSSDYLSHVRQSKNLSNVKKHFL
jgi:hypothetical protein